jgi:methyltransferase (TIGR00027 family)
VDCGTILILVLTMNDPHAGVRNISDTARWMAYFRAMESRRPDALFKDPHAEALAGERGFQIAKILSQANKQEWAWITRTYLFDSFISRLLQDGADMVVNLAAGLDARPYRMGLPSTVQWVEVDFAEIISYKEKILAGNTPRCRLERVALDLSDAQARRALFSDLDARARKIAVVSEGLLVYFAPTDVATLARDLARGSHFQNSIIDLSSTIQLIILQRTLGPLLSEADAAFKFGPPEGVDFFKPFGWDPMEVQGMLKTAAELKRAPEEFLPLLPDPDPVPPTFPWTGVCLLQKQNNRWHTQW